MSNKTAQLRASHDRQARARQAIRDAECPATLVLWGQHPHYADGKPIRLASGDTYIPLLLLFLALVCWALWMIAPTGR